MTPEILYLTNAGWVLDEMATIAGNEIPRCYLVCAAPVTGSRPIHGM